MSFIYTLLIISVIVVVHEFGHLLLAKKNGIEVVEFSVGFGPTLFAFEHGGTKYSLKLILFGGACQMTGENFLEEEATGEIPENSMMAKSPWARFSVIAAGPIFNFLLAFVLAIVLLAVGHVDLPIVHQVVKGSSAEQVGLQPGDKLLTINGEKIVIGRDVDLYLLTDPLMGEPVEITWERDGVKYSGTLDTKMERYMIGISYYVEQDAILSVVSEGYPAYEAGLRAGDLIVRIDDMEIADGRGIEAYFNANEIGENSIEIEYVRNGEHFVTQMTPKLYKYHDLGFMASGYRYEVSPLQVLRYAFTEVRYWIENTISSLAMMIRGQVGLDAVSGPV
ncbi:MAG: RIP metalloprotease RseP, partial [Lachnospiraceae bacterium]|nr:RIP metalloprotease RseP [Lachnospiraceae bacterium]